jgi:UDP-N-acetyl-D-glucosamine/UDP-N-acetyl-D-galactosamine dehydrogenase
MSLTQKLHDKNATLAVVGLGYVGLPIALEFAKHFKVIGFDINQKRVAMMQNGIDPSQELGSADFEGKDIVFTTDLEVLRQAQFFVVAVPTPVDSSKIPDLTPLLRASETLGKVLKKGDYVVYESTVYPGCTEEDCVPVLERISGLKFREDFKIGYSPERINPGDKERTIATITKIVSGCSPESAQVVADVYARIITAGVYKAASIKVAEAAKVIENTQRDLNISLMNELSIIFNKMGISTLDVIEAAATKWNFLRFYPGLVGGHCIGVDPYYLTHKAVQLGYDPQVILSGRRVNDGMPAYVAKKTIQAVIRAGKDAKAARVLVMGITFKENVSDIRNSKVAELITELQGYSATVHVVDPYAEAEEVHEEYGLTLTATVEDNYDAIVVAVNHKEYTDLTPEYFHSISKGTPILVDVKSTFRSMAHRDDLIYWAL